MTAGRSLDRLDAGRLRPRLSRHAGVAAPATPDPAAGTRSRRPGPIGPGRSPGRSAAEVARAPHGDDSLPRWLPCRIRYSIPPTRSRWSRSIDPRRPCLGREHGAGSSTKSAIAHGRLAGDPPSRAIALSPDGTDTGDSRLSQTGSGSGTWPRVESAGGGSSPRTSSTGADLLSRWPDGGRERRRFDETTKRLGCSSICGTRPLSPSTRRRIPGDWVRLWDLTFSPDGTILATATRDTEICDGDTLDRAREGLDASLGSRHRPGAEAIPRRRSRRPIARLLARRQAAGCRGQRRDGPVLRPRAPGRSAMPRLGPEPGDRRRRATSMPPRREPRAISYCLAFSPDGSILAAGTATGGSGWPWRFLARRNPPVGRCAGPGAHRIPAHQQMGRVPVVLARRQDAGLDGRRAGGPALGRRHGPRGVPSIRAPLGRLARSSSLRPTGRYSPAATMARSGSGTHLPAENWA